MLLVAGIWKEFEEFEELGWGANDNIWVFLTDTNGFFEMGVVCFFELQGNSTKVDTSCGWLHGLSWLFRVRRVNCVQNDQSINFCEQIFFNFGVFPFPSILVKFSTVLSFYLFSRISIIQDFPEFP